MSALDFIGGVAVFMLCMTWWAMRKKSPDYDDKEDDDSWPIRPVSSVVAVQSVQSGDGDSDTGFARAVREITKSGKPEDVELMKAQERMRQSGEGII